MDFLCVKNVDYPKNQKKIFCECSSDELLEHIHGVITNNFFKLLLG
jgi:hypothetical protein